MPRKNQNQVNEEKRSRAVTSSILLSVPFEMPPGDEYYPRHLEVQMTPEQARAARAIVIGLQERGERLRNDRLVQTHADAIRWLLERLDTLASSEASETSEPKRRVSAG